ncbi:DUF5666 domain-containing protein [Pseudomonas sp. dw_358]|uniref:DUF5666 domain-containing protein n=1 Tax=Pseudomonas sp. dw_358 TaxID=2720083 RepID=UPI001BD4EDD3|nr:DUF5666 domain-containing protein [Pseudomonas sp. dw_358]
MNTPLASFLKGSILATALLLCVANVQAADPQAMRVRGAITAIDGDTLKVHTNKGQDLSVSLSPDTRYQGITLANIADIKPGSYVGTAAIPQADGTLKALEVHVFPPAMAGTGDGHRAFDLGKNSTMTNGSVGDLVTSNGRTMTLNYKGGEKKVVVPDDVPVVNIVPGDRSLLKPGVKIIVSAKKADDGSLTASQVSAGENGVSPPM